MIIKITESQANAIRRRISAGLNYFPNLRSCNVDEANSEFITDSPRIDGDINYHTSFDNPLSIMLLGGLIIFYPPSKVRKFILKRYVISDSDVAIKEDDKNAIMVRILPDKSEDLVNELIRAMNLCGYYLSLPRPEIVSYWFEREKESPLVLQFEPKYGDTMKRDVIGNERELLHITQRKNLDKIYFNGLVPKSNNNLFNYPERIYLLKGSTPVIDIVELGLLLKNVYNIKSEDDPSSKYCIIHIDLKKVPDNVKFFTDINYSKYGIYTMDNIPPSAISGVSNFEI